MKSVGAAVLEIQFDLYRYRVRGAWDRGQI
jgi:hypothetical protein